MGITSAEVAGGYYQNQILTDGGAGPKISAVTLEQFFASESLEQVDFLAMDIEGAERFAIKGMSPTADRFQNVAIACHDFLADEGSGEELRTNLLIRDFLVGHDFDVEDRPDDPRAWFRGFLYGARAHPG